MTRKATLEDLDQLAVLFDNYRVFYEKKSDLGGARQFLSDRMRNGESEIFVSETVSETNEAVLAGFVQLYPVFSSTRMQRLWLLNDLFVAENYRGKGISVELINRAKELSEQTNAAGLILETAKTNSVGNSLYPSVGFVLDTEHNYYSWP
ncbi:MAG: GNAT family N-acetyltransferase [Cytophagales bacterium]|nr:GNAT family N-acetyltransferase [Cytophagales bacterium]